MYKLCSRLPLCEGVVTCVFFVTAGSSEKKYKNKYLTFLIPGCQTTRMVALVLKNQNKKKLKTISSVLDNSVYSLIIFNDRICITLFHR